MICGSVKGFNIRGSSHAICNIVYIYLEFSGPVETIAYAVTLIPTGNIGGTSFLVQIGNQNNTWYWFNDNLTARLLNFGATIPTTITMLQCVVGSNYGSAPLAGGHFDSVGVYESTVFTSSSNAVPNGDFEYPVLSGSGNNTYPSGWTGANSKVKSGTTALTVFVPYSSSSPAGAAPYLHYGALYTSIQGDAASASYKEIYYTYGANLPSYLSFAVDAWNLVASHDYMGVAVKDLTLGKTLFYELGLGASGVLSSNSTFKVIFSQLKGSGSSAYWTQFNKDWGDASGDWATQFSATPTSADNWQIQLWWGGAVGYGCFGLLDAINCGPQLMPQNTNFLFSDFTNPAENGTLNGQYTKFQTSAVDYGGWFCNSSLAASATQVAAQNLEFNIPTYNLKQIQICVGNCYLASYTGTANVYLVCQNMTSNGWTTYSNTTLFSSGTTYYSSGQIITITMSAYHSGAWQTYADQRVLVEMTTAAASTLQYRVVLKWVAVEIQDSSILPAPTGLTPYFGYTCLNSSVKLTWNNITAGAGLAPLDHFIVRWAQDNGFTINVNNASVARSSLTYTMSVSIGEYFWDVCGISTSSIRGNWSNTEMFQVVPYTSVSVLYSDLDGYGIPFNTGETYFNGSLVTTQPANFIVNVGHHLNLTVTDYFSNIIYGPHNYVINGSQTILTIQLQLLSVSLSAFRETVCNITQSSLVKTLRFTDSTTTLLKPGTYTFSGWANNNTAYNGVAMTFNKAVTVSYTGATVILVNAPLIITAITFSTSQTAYSYAVACSETASTVWFKIWDNLSLVVPKTYGLSTMQPKSTVIGLHNLTFEVGDNNGWKYNYSSSYTVLIRGVYFEYYSSIDGLGLDWNTAQLWCNGSRVYNQNYETTSNHIHIQVKDYFGNMINDTIIPYASVIQIGLGYYEVSWINAGENPIIMNCSRSGVNQTLTIAAGGSVTLRMINGAYTAYAFGVRNTTLTAWFETRIITVGSTATNFTFSDLIHGYADVKYVNAFDANLAGIEAINFNTKYYLPSLAKWMWLSCYNPTIKMLTNEKVNITVLDNLGGILINNQQYVYNETIQIPVPVYTVKVKSYGDNAFGAVYLHRTGTGSGMGAKPLLGEYDIVTYFIYNGSYELDVHYTYIAANGILVPVDIWINSTYIVNSTYAPAYCAGFLVANSSAPNIIDVLNTAQAGLTSVTGSINQTVIPTAQSIANGVNDIATKAVTKSELNGKFSDWTVYLDVIIVVGVAFFIAVPLMLAHYKELDVSRKKKDATRKGVANEREKKLRQLLGTP